MDLQPTDIIKADIIGKIDGERNKDIYNKKWEDMEVELGRSRFNDLFTYVRMISAKKKAKSDLLKEFRTHVLRDDLTTKALIEDVLEPCADALKIIKDSNYKASTNASDVNTHLRWLNQIEDSDWIPPAILFLSQNHKPDYVFWFFKKLERLASCMYVCAKNVNKRIERYAELIKGLEGNHSLEAPVSKVELTEIEKHSMKKVLDGNVYELTTRRKKYIILRLDAFLSDGRATYNSSILTVEHVLPQTVNPESEWATTWPDFDKRQDWIHKIANLVPLNQRRNSKAQNYDFDRKKSAYFTGKEQVSSYALTTQVLSESEWTPEVLAKRQKDLLTVLTKNWELGESEQ